MEGIEERGEDNASYGNVVHETQCGGSQEGIAMDKVWRIV